MVNPCPGYSITTPYWKAGSAWGCGYHDGVDLAAPSGTDIVAAWGGTVVEAAYPTSFGSAFGRAVVIDHDKLPDGSPGGWGLYAHMSAENVSVGQRVEAGQKIGDVGTTGNSSGNHLHFGVYMTDHWTSCGGKNPQPWIDAGAVGPGDVYLSKLHYGQEDSDSVRRLQLALNGHSLEPPGHITLDVSGNYLDNTDTVVRADQDQHGYGNDPAKASSVGPKQAEHLFAGTGNTIINDLEQPEEPTVSGDWEDVGGGLLFWWTGKDTDEWVLHPDGDWHDIPGFVQPPSDKDGREDHFIYLRCILPDGRSADRVVEVRFIRSNGDETAYDHWTLGLVKDSYPLPSLHTEKGSGLGGRWQASITGGTDPATITTRYAKTWVDSRK